jgi:hypothetical protein
MPAPGTSHQPDLAPIAVRALAAAIQSLPWCWEDEIAELDCHPELTVGEVGLLGEAIPLPWWDIIGPDDCRRLLACLHVVSWKLAQPGAPPLCSVAEELCAHALLCEAEDALLAWAEIKTPEELRELAVAFTAPDEIVAPEALSGTLTDLRQTLCALPHPLADEERPFGLDDLTVFDLFTPRDASQEAHPGCVWEPHMLPRGAGQHGSRQGVR